jgi:hypothetical protein
VKKQKTERVKDGMMKNPKADLDEAIERWLDSYRGYQDYLTATETLFKVFAENWRGWPRSLTEAFATFREALLTDSKFNPLEVSEVYPHRRPECQ